MPLDLRAKRFLDVLAAGKPPRVWDSTVAERRAGLTELLKFGGPEVAVAHVANRTVPGPAGPLAVRVYTPHLESADEAAASTVVPGAGMVYFHGGGLIAGTAATHDGIARALASAGGCRIVSVEYRLAPEHPFPAAVEDAEAALRFIARNASDFGIAAARLGVCGDSAGGTLAAVAAQAAGAAGTPALALQLLICPILDQSRSTGSRREFDSGYLIDQGTLDHDLLHYLPAGADPADPRISPLRAKKLTALPRTVIHTAEFDPVRDEGHAYFERLRQSSVPVSYTCHPGMIHLFYGLGSVIPYARTAFEQIGSEIRAALG
jgi:acetyl esterase